MALNQGKYFQEKIIFYSEVLSKWDKEITGSFKTRINQCKKIMRIMKGRMDTNSAQIYNDATKRLTEIYNEQEVFWRQRCKHLWLREGDSNSKIFHIAVKSRRKINKITTLTNNEVCLVGWILASKRL